MSDIKMFEGIVDKEAYLDKLKDSIDWDYFLDSLTSYYRNTEEDQSVDWEKVARLQVEQSRERMDHRDRHMV